MSVFSKLVHKTGVISIKIPPHYFIELNNLILKFIWKNKSVGIGRKTWERTIVCGGRNKTYQIFKHIIKPV